MFSCEQSQVRGRSPRPSFILGFERAWSASSDITFNQRGCVHGNAFFHHDIVPECLWPGASTLVVRLTVQ